MIFRLLVRSSHSIAARRLLAGAWLVLLALPLACGASEDEPADPSDHEPPEWAQEVYADPPAFKTFEVAGHRFRIPYDYSRQSDEGDGKFQMSVLWPTLDPYWTDKPQPRNREDFDTLQVTVRALESYAWYQAGIWDRIADVEMAVERGQELIQRRADLTRVEGGHFWVTMRPIILADREQVIKIPCDPDANESRVGRCRVNYIAFGEIKVQIKFDRKLFDDWRTIVNRVHNLLAEFRRDR